MRSAGWKVLQIAFTLLDPFRVNQTLSLSIELLVGTANCSIADVRNLRDFLGRFTMTHEIGCHVNTRCNNRQRRPAGQIAHGRDPVRKRRRYAGDLVGQVEEVAKPVAEIAGFGGGGCGISVVGVWDTTVRHHRVNAFKVLVREEFLQSLVNTPDLFPRHLRYCKDLRECTRHLALATGDKNATCDDHILRLALKGFRVIDHLEKVFCRVGYILLNVETVA